MLTLDRKFNQVIRVNEDISITVIQLATGKVKIAIQAPTDVPVFRCKVVDYRIPASLRGGQEVRRKIAERKLRVVRAE